MRIASTAMSAIRGRRLTGFAPIALAAACMIAWTAPASAQNTPSIAGLWHIELIKQDGSLYYQSLQEYHADGLEMEDAATPPTHPAHICMGIWKQEGSTVNIYHVIWTYDGDGPPVGYVVLTENNELGQDGNSLSGTFEMKQYDIHDGRLLGRMAGATAGRRIDFAHPFNLFGTGAGALDPRSTATGWVGAAVPPC